MCKAISPFSVGARFKRNRFHPHSKNMSETSKHGTLGNLLYPNVDCLIIQVVMIDESSTLAFLNLTL